MSSDLCRAEVTALTADGEARSCSLVLRPYPARAVIAPVSDLSAARIRLEGALEIVETVTTSLERAEADLALGHTEQVAATLALRDEPRTLHARAALERLLDDEPALGPVLERFSSAKRALDGRVRARAALLGLEGEAVNTALETLHAEPLLYAGRVGAWGLLLVLGVGFVVMGVVTWGERGWGLFIAVAAAAMAYVFFGAPRVVVTRRRVCIGPQVVLLAEVRSVQVARVITRGARNNRHVHYELSFEGDPSGPRTFRLPAFPSSLRRALEATGLPCHCAW